MAKKDALGKGLGALIEGANDDRRHGASINEIDIDKIEVNPFQPRKNFDEETLLELTASIKEIGIIQPITVRLINGDRYQLITGERRFKAAVQAGLDRIPAYIRQANDQNMLEMSLVENIQREDLDSIEVAISYQRLIEECNLTQENLSDRVGKKRSTIANYLRLLKLPAEIQLGIRDRLISMGHARTIVNIPDPNLQLEVYENIIKEDLSVRKVEDLVRKLGRAGAKTDKTAKVKPGDMPYDALRNQLSGVFKADVEFKRNNKGIGKIVIPFKTDADLERIIAILDKLKV
ncbi:MAG: ParB/RepB/Spo0J family partition protein [Bacteroidales bacterium]|nr:ParB/RepB/Spo0J family partition protein [Bacteroidales bacterium]